MPYVPQSDSSGAFAPTPAAVYLLMSQSDVVGLGLEQLLKAHLKGVQVRREIAWRNVSIPRSLNVAGVIGDYPLTGEDTRMVGLLNRRFKVPFWLFLDDLSSVEQRWVHLERAEHMFRLPLGTRAEHILQLLVNQRQVNLRQDSAAHARLDEAKWPLLTRKEWQVFHLLGAGKSAKQIAGVLGNAVPTIRNHLNSIYRKINAKNRRAAIQIYNS